MPFDLEKTIAAWRRSYEVNPAFSTEDIEELEGSLRDRVEALVERGYTKEKAFGMAIKRIGSSSAAEKEYKKVYWGKLKRQRKLVEELRWRGAMMKNYLKVAWRNVTREKGFALINIAGLTVGLVSSFFIFLWVSSERSVDQFHETGDRIYRVWRNETNNQKVFTRGTMPGSMGPALTEEYPEVENATYVWPELGFMISSGDQSFREKGSYVSSDFFDVFSFPLLLGNPVSALEAKASAVISESLARKLFGVDWQHIGVIGKTITKDHNEDLIITGVAKDAPHNSTIRFDVLLPIDAFFAKNRWALKWDGNAFPLYVRLGQGASLEGVNVKVANVIEKHSPNIQGEVVFLQPFEEAYLHSRFENGVNTGGRIDLVRIFSVVAIFLLVIAAINFMNLATARSAQRLKEIGVRKAIGATQPSLAIQFMSETMLLAALSLSFALVVKLCLLPTFNQLTGKNFHILDLNLAFFMSALGITLVTGMFAGSYPAFYFSSFNPIAILRRTFRQKPGETRMRKVLVVFQFALSTLLIIYTAAVYFQVSYILDRNLGLDRSNLISFELEGGVRTQYDSFRQELMQRPGIENVTASSGNPLTMDFGRTTSSPNWTGKDPDDETEFSLIDIDYRFVETMKMNLVAGRAHSPAFGADADGYIINEQAAKVIGKASLVGERLDLFGRPGRVIGVVEDFHTGYISAPVSPAIMRLAPVNASLVWVRTEPGTTQEALNGLQAVYEAFNPGYPFSYSFMDMEYEGMYRSVLIMGRLTNVFAVVALFISCLGLFGLAAFMAQKRKKEIGVRKVLGASFSSIIKLLSADYLKLVVIAFFVAALPAYVAMERWLDGFAYHIVIGPGIFFLAGVIMVSITLLTVGYQAFKVAIADPVKSLRHE